ncbi:MAG: FAD-linked oxidase C-terminal domain-containing protein, partial [Myxococcota bacterium]
LGIITEATVQVRPRAESSAIRTFLFRTFEAGAAAIRSVVQSGVPVAMMRLSDADETYFYGTLKSLRQPPSALTSLGERGLDAIGLGAGVGDGRCALLVGIDGTEGDVKRHHRRVTSLCAAEGGVPIGAGPGRSWRKSRFATPYLRSPMLDRGLGIDTLETATHWTNVVPLWKRVRSAIEDSLGPCAVLAHISHAYRSGCSLYFTFLFLRDARDPMAQWRRVKAAASEAIATGGGTISHHHGVGLDHAPWMKRETGTLGMQMLAGAKAAVDPQGILNPGKLGLE